MIVGKNTDGCGQADAQMIIGASTYNVNINSNDDPNPKRYCTVSTSEEDVQSSTRPKAGQLGHWQVLLLGQGIALVAASANACSFTLIYNLGVQIPMTELFITYALLALIHVRQMLRKRHKTEVSMTMGRHYVQGRVTPLATTSTTLIPTSENNLLPGSRIKLHVPWWVYTIVSLLDVLANFSTLLSFRYTSLTSTSLLGSLTIPSVMVVSWLLLGRIFSTNHYVGVALCLVGGIMTVWLDSSSSNSSHGDGQSGTTTTSAPTFFGDALAIVAALLYGLGDSLAEYSIKHMDRVEYLFMIGLCGACITGIHVPFVEGHQLYHLVMETSATRQLQALTGIVFYVTGLILYYISATIFLVHADATLLVLSLQATQFWAILFSVVAEHHPPAPLFFVAVVLVVSGVFLYEMTNDAGPSVSQNDGDDDNDVDEGRLESSPLVSEIQSSTLVYTN